MERDRENGPTANDDPSLQDEQEEVNSSRHKSVKERWTYEPAEKEPSQSTGDLGSKWGHNELQEDDGGRWTRATRKRKTRVSVAIAEDGGRLSRRFADLGHRFSRNPGESNIGGLATRTDPEEEVEGCLSGGLTAEKDCSRGDLTAGLGRSSRGLTTNDSSGEQIESGMEGESLAAEFGRAETRHELSPRDEFPFLV
ncbi:hypothetical protein JOM56_000861 [Amanita muscaria]